MPFVNGQISKNIVNCVYYCLFSTFSMTRSTCCLFIYYSKTVIQMLEIIQRSSVSIDFKLSSLKRMINSSYIFRSVIVCFESVHQSGSSKLCPSGVESTIGTTHAFAVTHRNASKNYPRYQLLDMMNCSSPLANAIKQLLYHEGIVQASLHFWRCGQTKVYVYRCVTLQVRFKAD